MSNFNIMYAKLPEVMKQTNNEKMFTAIGSLFDDFVSYMTEEENSHVIDLAIGTQLDAIGYNTGIPRSTEWTDEQYRRRLHYFYSSIYLVPTLNNFYHLIYSILGEYPENVKEGWKYTGESGFLELDVIYPGNETDDLLDDLDRLYGAGCRLKWNRFKRVWACYNQIGDYNPTGFTEIFDDKGLVKHPWDGYQFSMTESTSDITATTEEIQELDEFIVPEAI